MVCFSFLRLERDSEEGKQMSVSADEPFVFVFIPCLVEFFDVCDMYCVLLLSNGFSLT